MSTNAPDDDAPSREEIADTWRWKQDAASWQANLAFPGGDAAAVNRWMAVTLAGLLADLTPLSRVRTATLLPNDGPIHLTRRAEEPYAQFRAQMLDAISGNQLPVTYVELALDVRVWVRTTDSPDRPELAWLSYPGVELRLQLLTTEGRAWVDFSIENTLFSAFTYPDEDPNPLYPLNHPLLEAALHRLRARSTEPLDRTGELKGMYEFGFSPDRDDY
jgi:hypothetical protein